MEFCKTYHLTNSNIKITLPQGTEVSDGHHTFDELYEHINVSFAALLSTNAGSWKSKLHHNGTMSEGWFIAGLHITQGNQITYHFPIKMWDEMIHVKELERAPEWAGHSPKDCIGRLYKFCID